MSCDRRSCKSWTLRQSMAIAKKLSALLYKHPYVTGVALTGSAGRLEDHIHDLDLIVLHDGKCQDGLAPRPLWNPTDPYDRRKNLVLHDALNDTVLAKQLEKARKDIPVDFIFAKERILVDCRYLMERGETTYDINFFKRVFNELPLRLLIPALAKGAVKEVSRTTPIKSVNTRWYTSVSYKDLAHHCNSVKCRPSVFWEERQRCRDLERAARTSTWSHY